MLDSSYKKWKISIFSTFLFILTLVFTQKMLNLDKIPLITTRSLVIRALVYLLLVRGSMNLKLF